MEAHSFCRLRIKTRLPCEVGCRLDLDDLDLDAGQDAGRDAEHQRLRAGHLGGRRRRQAVADCITLQIPVTESLPPVIRDGRAGHFR